MASKLVVGMVGGGVVGGGVVEMLAAKRDQLQKLGAHIRISKLCVRDINKQRDFALDKNTKLVNDYKAIIDDPEINCVVELMGGVGDAKSVVFESIKRGKHVVTANKALVASFLPELIALLKEHPNVRFGYEASVAGGIPIIDTLRRSFLGDEVTQVAGIMNGTTNYILTKMDKEHADYSDVLKDAQRLGFAEADPTADVEGHDVQAKIALLTKLAFGVNVPLECIPTMGISRITSIDFEYAKMLQSTIKLLGVSKKIAEKKIAVYVSPMLVPLSNDIAGIGGAENVVNVESKNLKSSSFVGFGAGRFPTANSVVSDIIHIALGSAAANPFPLEEQMQLQDDYEARFYLRMNIKDQLGIIKRVGEIAENHKVSINAVLQNHIQDRSDVNFVVETEKTTLSNVRDMAGTISKEPWSKSDPLVMPFLS